MTAKRYDEGKRPVVEGCFNYFPRALLAVGLVSESGSKKYEVSLSEKNWLGLEQARIVNSEGRHLLKEAIEGPYDRDSNLLHKAHKAWNALADLEKELSKGTPLERPDLLCGTGPADELDMERESWLAKKRQEEMIKIQGDLAASHPPPADKGVGAKAPEAVKGTFANPEWEGEGWEPKHEDLVCTNCGQSFGAHYWLDCPGPR